MVQGQIWAGFQNHSFSCEGGSSICAGCWVCGVEAVPRCGAAVRTPPRLRGGCCYLPFTGGPGTAEAGPFCSPPFFEVVSSLHRAMHLPFGARTCHVSRCPSPGMARVGGRHRSVVGGEKPRPASVFTELRDSTYMSWHLAQGTVPDSDQTSDSAANWQTIQRNLLNSTKTTQSAKLPTTENLQSNTLGPPTANSLKKEKKRRDNL